MTFIYSIINPTRRWLLSDTLRWIKPLSAGFVLLASFFLSPRIAAGNRILSLVFLAYMGGLAALVLLRWPTLGLGVTLIAGFFIPFSGPGGFNASQVAVGMMLVLWIFGVITQKQEFRLIKSRAIKPLLFFVVISVLAFAIGQIPWYSFAMNAPIVAQLGGFAIFILSAGLFLWVAYQIRDLRWLKWITWLFIFLGGLFIIARLVGRPGYFITELFHLRVAAGSMFWTWLVALSMSQAVFNQNLDKRWRILLGGLVLATFYAAYFQSGDWKSGWVPPLFAAATILMLRFWGWARYLTPLAVFPTWQVVSKAILTEQYSWGTRVDAWLIVTEIVKVNPLLGLGFANYYWYTPLFPIRGWYVNFNSHSQYVDIFAQTGLCGLACFLWLLFELGLLGWSLRERAAEGFARAYVYGALGGLVGTFVAGFMVDWILPFVYNLGLNGFRASLLAWIFLGGLVSVEQITRNRTMPSALG
jgi:hypothetical protein